MRVPEGIRAQEANNRGSYWEAYFEILTPNLEEPLQNILDWMTPERELFLHDYRRGDVEGGVIVTLKEEILHLMKGGHGYSSQWKTVTTAKAIEELIDASKSNQGNGVFAHGYLSEKIPHNKRMHPDAAKPRR